MKDELSVLVGTGIGGQREIISALSDAGFNTQSTGGRMWPRNHYVHLMDRYVKNGSVMSIDGNPFGDGGHVLTGNDFLLVSDMAYLREDISKNLSNRSTYEQIKEAIVSEGKKYHPNARIHVAPTGYFHNGKGHDHIDMFCLLLPKQKLLLLDTHYGKGAGNAKEYDTIAKAEGLRLIRYNGSQDGVWFPLNSLVLPTEDEKEVVFVDSKAKSLIKLLINEGLKPIEVEMPQHSYPAGKIGCQTNTYNSKDKSLVFDKLLERI